MMDFVAAMNSPKLFGPWFRGPSWDTWRAVMKAAYALPMAAYELEAFKAVAGDRALPTKRVRELWASPGRRAGKDSIASAIVTHAAITFEPEGRLRPGERALCLCLAVDREQAKIVLGYVRAYFQEIPALGALVTRETKDGLELSNGVDICVSTNSFRAVRGRTILTVVLDEIAYWRSEESATPDLEVYRALLPGMATLPGAMLIGISSPYKRSGLLYQKHKAHFGQDGDVLFVAGASRDFNPTLDQAEIDRALEEDPAAARAEWLGQFRDDVLGFLTMALIEAAVDEGVVVRPPLPNVHYVAAVDASSGTGKDSYTLAICHREGDAAVLDLVHEIRPPFNAQTATAEIAKVAKEYRIREAVGDKWSPGFVSEAFARNNIAYRYSERDRSGNYLEALPLFTSGRVRLVDNKRLTAQFANLERRTSSTGRDRVDHPAAGHDDLSNAAALALTLANSRRPMEISPEAMRILCGPRRRPLIAW